MELDIFESVEVESPRLPAVSAHERYAGVAELARILDASENTIRRWAGDRLIPSLRTPGGQFRFDVAAVLAALQTDRAA